LNAIIANYLFQADDATVASKMPAADKNLLNSTCKEAVEWLNKNQNATEEQYVRKKQEIENKLKSIIMNLYSAGSGQNQTDRQFPSAGGAGRGGNGPIIDEVD
jgi:heat shock protein 1/8